jgi:hypothetical protein
MKQSLEEAKRVSGKYTLDYRICHLMLFFAASDSQLSEAEITKTALYIKALQEKIGSDTDLKELMLGCLEDMKNNGNVEVLKETIAIFAQHMPNNVLVTIAQSIADVANADGLSQGEADLLNQLKLDWQLA